MKPLVSQYCTENCVKNWPTVCTKKTICWVCPIFICNCASINTRVYAGSLNDGKTDLIFIPCTEEGKKKRFTCDFRPSNINKVLQEMSNNLNLVEKTYFFSVFAISTSFLYHLIVESLRTLKNWHHNFTCPDVSAKVSLLILRITWGAEGNQTQQWNH